MFDGKVLIEFKHYIYNYLYHKSNIRLAGMLLDIELEGDKVAFYLTLPNVTSEGSFILTKIKLKDIAKSLEENDDDLQIFAGTYYDIIMEQIINIENEEADGTKD